MPSKCYDPVAPENGPPLIQNGNITFQAHDVGWIVSGFFAIVATVASLWLVNKHLQWYTNKREQRYIVRILFMVPLYAIVSFASYLFWNESTPLLLVRDCYESTVLTAFFYLLLMYLSPDPDEQKAIVRSVALSRENDRKALQKGEPTKKWVFPLNYMRWKPEDGLHFLQIMKWGVLQYCVIRPLTTLTGVIMEYMGYYCNGSWSFKYGYLYITIIVSLSVTVAMYCLLQLYIPLAGHLAHHKPLLKLFAIKAVVFLTFWQSTFISALNMFGVVKNTPYMTADDIDIGIGAILETFEMMCFAFLHIRAFTYKPYRPPYHPALTSDPPPQRTPRLKSLVNAMDMRETFREVWSGTVYIVHRSRGIETDPIARRSAIHADAFGRVRPQPTEGLPIQDQGQKQRGSRWDGFVEEETSAGVKVHVEQEVDVGGERQWLGLGDDYIYGLGYYSRRERSEALSTQIDKELEKRGYARRERTRDQRQEQDEPDVEQGHHRGQRSWWRSMYNHLSQSNADHEGDDDGQGQKLLAPPTPSRKHKSRSNRQSRQRGVQYDDAPPPSIIRAHKNSRQKPQPQLPPIPLRDPATGSGPESEPRDSPPGLPLHRGDSLLGRVFPHPLSDAASAHTTINAPSSQSHANQVKLVAAPFAIPTDSVMSRTPVLVQQPVPVAVPVLAPQSPPEPERPVVAPQEMQAEAVPSPSRGPVLGEEKRLSRGRPLMKDRRLSAQEQYGSPLSALALSLQQAPEHAAQVKSLSPPSRQHRHPRQSAQLVSPPPREYTGVELSLLSRQPQEQCRQGERAHAAYRKSFSRVDEAASSDSDSATSPPPRPPHKHNRQSAHYGSPTRVVPNNDVAASLSSPRHRPAQYGSPTRADPPAPVIPPYPTLTDRLPPGQNGRPHPRVVLPSLLGPVSGITTSPLTSSPEPSGYQASLIPTNSPDSLLTGTSRPRYPAPTRRNQAARHSYSRHSNANRRLSTPLETIPQGSVSPPPRLVENDQQISLDNAVGDSTVTSPSSSYPGPLPPRTFITTPSNGVAPDRHLRSPKGDVRAARQPWP